jgi:putative tricarboxylic transport membrane protein
MDKSAVRSALPYFVGLAVAAVLYVYAGQIEYAPRSGLLGPDFWPKAAIALMVLTCISEIVRNLFRLKVEETHGFAEALEKQDEEEEKVQTYPALLSGGIVLVLVYAALVTTLGFFLSTFLFLGAFMYLGRYRRHVMVWSVSGFITIMAALIFTRLAYVSLPRGIPPFDMITDFVRIILGG